MTEKYLNFINGHWKESSNGEFFEDINPADTNDIVGTFPSSTAQDVDEAVRAAQNAFDKWRPRTRPKKRRRT